MKAIETIAYRTYRAVIITGLYLRERRIGTARRPSLFQRESHTFGGRISPYQRAASAVRETRRSSRAGLRPSRPNALKSLAHRVRRGCAETALVQESPAERAE